MVGMRDAQHEARFPPAVHVRIPKASGVWIRSQHVAHY